MENCYLRLATKDDCKLLFNWRNDETVRNSAFSSNVIKSEEHKKWFLNKLESIKCKIYILQSDTIPVGQIRFDIVNDVAEIDYSIDKNQRGKQYGKKIVELGIQQLRKEETTVESILAKVKSENTASRKIFNSLGFKETQESRFVVYKKTLIRNVIAISNENYENSDLFKIPNVEFIRTKDELSFQKLSEIQPDYVFFPHWSYMIPAEIYENFKCVIFHMTDLPFGRGGSPLQNLIVRKIYDTKISAIRCVKDIDAGEIYLKKDFSIKDGSATELYKKAGNIIALMIEEIIQTNPIPVCQSGDIVEFKRRTPEQSNVINLFDTQSLYDYIRMLDAEGYPKAFVDIKGFKIEFFDAKRIDKRSIEARVTIKEHKKVSRKVLVVVAHPDDELLGVGGTIAKLSSEGYDCRCVILGEGAVSRKQTENDKDMAELESLHNDSIKASKIIGFSRIEFINLPDNRFDSVNLLDIVKIVEKIVKEYSPDIVFTHYGNDLNVDHQQTFKAVLTATRPIGNQSVKKVYCFDTLSSSEWNFGSTVFAPNYFVDISDFVNIKKDAMKCYKSELCKYPHPRSLEGIEAQARRYGTIVSMQYAEAFMLVRELNWNFDGGGYI